MRAFIALEVSEGFADDIAGLARQLGAVVEGRFLPRSIYHLTLAFLGEVDKREISASMAAIDAACADAAPIPLRSDGLGKFGRPSDATLWLGIAPVPTLMLFAERIREELARRNVPFDDKPFKPHITLARRACIPKGSLPALAFPEIGEASAVVLFKSTLSKEGATYKPLHTAALTQ